MSATDEHDLSGAIHVSKSRSRRLRSAKLKQRLWETAAFNSFSFHQIHLPPWWQPEPEQPQLELADHECCVDTADAVKPNAVYYDELPSRPDHLPCDAPEADPKSTFKSIMLDLGTVQDRLSCWLYGDGICAQNGLVCTPNICSLDDDGNHVDSVAVTVASLDASDTFQDEDLLCIKRSVADALAALTRAAHVANVVESKSYSEFDWDDIEVDSLTSFFMDAYFNYVPEGIGKRHTRNVEIEEEIENEERDMRIALLGYSFTFNRPLFWSLLHRVPKELHKEFVEFGISHLPSKERPPLDKADIEKLFFQDERAANDWQECYSDVDDDDDLLTLLKMLRRVEGCTYPRFGKQTHG